MKLFLTNGSRWMIIFNHFFRPRYIDNRYLVWFLIKILKIPIDN